MKWVLRLSKRFARALHTLGAACALACLVFTTGCAIDQKREVALYRGVLDERVAPAPAYSPDDELSLVAAMRLANQNNEQLGMRGEEYVQALIAKNRAVAGFLPTVSFQPSFALEQVKRGDAGTTTGGGFRQGELSAKRLDAPVIGNINLFRGFGDVANAKSADATIAQRKSLLRDAQAAVLLNVAQVYYQVLRSERSFEVLRNSLKVQEARLADVRQQLKNGLATALSVAQSRAQADATRVAFVQAQGDVWNGRSTLAFLIGTSAVRGPLRDDFKVPLPAGRRTESEHEADALTGRDDLAAARAAVDSARHAVDVAFAQYYPSISLNVAGFLYREFYADASKWNTVLSANLPIFSAGVIEADVRSAWSRLREAALYESYLRRQVQNDVQLAYQNVETADGRARELEDELQATRDAFQQARNAFDNKLAINLDVLTAQDQLLNSELQLASAQFDRVVFYLDLLRASGQLVQTVARK